MGLVSFWGFWPEFYYSWVSFVQSRYCMILNEWARNCEEMETEWIQKVERDVIHYSIYVNLEAEQTEEREKNATHKYFSIT